MIVVDLAAAEQEMVDPWGPGERVGTYVVRSLIGRGGMSSVWEAWDPELHRVVALKTIAGPDPGDQMLVNEARALAAVRHPGLPAVHGLGRSRGRRYLVLERLFGDTLERTLRQQAGGLDAPDALRILVDVASILHAVHQAGMVHHDVKPANIMLCPTRRTVLLDFGIMMPAVGAATYERSGTPGYLAPEVLLDTVTADRARLIDVYAFGVIAYEMLTGRMPFRGADLQALMHESLSAVPPDLRTARSDAPVALEALVRACLAKNPDDRPDDMEVVQSELARVGRELQRRRPTRATLS